MLKPIEVILPAVSAYTYPIWIKDNLFANICALIPKNISTLIIITDDNVENFYAATIENNLKKDGYETLLLSFVAGEKSKNIHTKSKLEEQMFEHGCDRDSLILALGGGVVGDMAGFIAATYMRGIRYIQAPTTLLAMLDSSVGGKTGIDTPQGKNLIGAFWHPTVVISDIDCLKTLPQKQIINGLIEAFKMFLTNDADSLNDLDNNLQLILNVDAKLLTKLVQNAVTIKKDIVQNDEKERGQRAVLNFGHTIGHALEKLSDYKLLHGYAVALGILVEAKIAESMGLLQAKDYLFIKNFLSKLNIRSSELKDFDVDEVILCTQSDKKKLAGRVRYVLINGLGSVYTMGNQFAHPVSDEMVKNAFLGV